MYIDYNAIHSKAIHIIWYWSVLLHPYYIPLPATYYLTRFLHFFSDRWMSNRYKGNINHKLCILFNSFTTPLFPFPDTGGISLFFFFTWSIFFKTPGRFCWCGYIITVTIVIAIGQVSDVMVLVDTRGSCLNRKTFTKNTTQWHTYITKCHDSLF